MLHAAKYVQPAIWETRASTGGRSELGARIVESASPVSGGATSQSAASRPWGRVDIAASPANEMNEINRADRTPTRCTRCRPLPARWRVPASGRASAFSLNTHTTSRRHPPFFVAPGRPPPPAPHAAVTPAASPLARVPLCPPGATQPPVKRVCAARVLTLESALNIRPEDDPDTRGGAARPEESRRVVPHLVPDVRAGASGCPSWREAGAGGRVCPPPARAPASFFTKLSPFAGFAPAVRIIQRFAPQCATAFVSSASGCVRSFWPPSGPPATPPLRLELLGCRARCRGI